MDNCPLCKREMVYKRKHHLVPISRGGKHDVKVLVCEDCHSSIHSLFSNKELERKYNSAEALLNDERFAKMAEFLAKRDPHRRYKTKLSNSQRYRGRNG